jgi:hypothetical protein
MRLRADRQADAAVPDQMIQFRRAQIGVQRDDAGPQAVQGHPVQDGGRPVFQHQTDPMTDAIPGRAITPGELADLSRRLGVSQGSRRNVITFRGAVGDMQERPVMPGMSGVPECRENSGGQSGSQSNTSPERSSGMNAALSAGAAWAAMLSGVQPSARCTMRIGRGELNR